MNGDAVEVLRINAEGENGFSYIRMATVDGFAEGFIKSCYLTLRALDASVAALAAVHRGEFGHIVTAFSSFEFVTCFRRRRNVHHAAQAR